MTCLFLRRLFPLLLLCLTFLPPPTVQAAPAPPVMRLGDAVRPLAYNLALTLDPQQDRFEGRITIALEFARPADFFWLNGQELTVRRAVLSQAGKSQVAEVSTGGTDFLGMQFAQPFAAGAATLVIEYSGAFEKNNTRGLFKQQDGGNWYALSQFEATSARRAFPCFDEPQWKTPWTLALTVRRDHVAVSNMPQVSEVELGNDLKQVTFEPTAPLPSYLVALGVGPFDIVDGGVAGMNKTHLRYIAPKGRGNETRYAARVTPRILALLENYFGRPYPFKKLDSMVIPVTVNFGAMENVGLITYRSTLMLARPEQENERFQQSYASVAAHEIAHQWFGDLVTMRWWTDVWLNESFATWMARKTMQSFNPAWDNTGARERERQIALQVDQLRSTRQIRQPVNVADDLANSFDSITYDKGGAVLAMFESYLGETAFRDGVRRYLKRHEFGNASAEDFFAAMSESDPQLGNGFASFVEQPGVPRVSMTLDCSAKPLVKLSQQRFIAGEAEASGSQTWTLPVCVRYPAASGSRQACTLLSEKTGSIALPDATSCPAWILPNPAGTGYFLSRIAPASLAALATAPLSPAERVALSGDLALQARSGAFPMENALMLAAAEIDDPSPEVAMAAVGIVRGINPALLDMSGRAQLAAWIVRHFGQRAEALGWLPRAGESDATSKLRGMLLPLVTQVGRHPGLQQQANELATQWLAQRDTNRLGVMLEPVLESAAFAGDSTLQAGLIKVASTSADRRERGYAFQALGAFSDPALQQGAFAILLDERFDIRDASNIMQSASAQTEHAMALQTFIRANYERLAARVPSETIARLPRYGARLCSAQERTVFQDFYQGRVTQLPGATRNLAQAVEAIDICIANRRLQQDSLTRFLATAS